MGATASVQIRDQLLPVLCHCQLGQDIPCKLREISIHKLPVGDVVFTVNTFQQVRQLKKHRIAKKLGAHFGSPNVSSQ